MFRASSLVVLLGACSFSPMASSDGGVVDTVDATDAAMIDMGPGCDFALHVDACMLSAAPATGLMLTGSISFDTDTMAFTPAQDSATYVVVTAPQKTDATAMVTVIRTHDLTIADKALLKVSGSVPLVIVSDTTMSIAGVIDVGSHVTGKAGAGAPTAATCGASAGSDGDSTGDGGGGGGGAFQNDGGSGGDGVAAVGGTNGGGQSLPSSIAGGCPGGHGGLASGGGGGSGGGAIELSAHDAIALVMNGGINAGGAAGIGGGQGAGFNFGGGGGGGAGGYIGLDAPMVTLTNALVSANGGGGGGGGNGLAQAGVDGKLGRGAASGGSGRMGASNGGGGGALASPVGGTPLPSVAGGGGGGGGVGYIRIHTTTLSTPMTTLSPAPTLQ